MEELLMPVMIQSDACTIRQANKIKDNYLLFYLKSWVWQVMQKTDMYGQVQVRKYWPMQILIYEAWMS